MPTIKLVVIGSSGVGKTSLRGQYISGRFSTGYRATIGADFIAKTLPHPSKPNAEPITLQIWDTAGQERFSSLSNAFFRGADAALFVFDANRPSTLVDLAKWWDEFQHRAPLSTRADAETFCAVVVGNKVDLLAEGGPRVSVEDAQAFLAGMIPPDESATTEEEDARVQLSLELSPTSSEGTADRLPLPLPPSTPSPSSPESPTSPHFPPRARPRHAPSRLRASSGGWDTARSTASTQTIYHTPSSSFSDAYDTVRTSPPSLLRVPSAAGTEPADGESGAEGVETDTESGVTMTPSLFARAARESASASTSTTPEGASDSVVERGPQLFWASAKTGEGVTDVFEYVARRVVRRWAWEEAEGGHLMQGAEATGETVRVGLVERSKRNTWASGCCT